MFRPRRVHRPADNRTAGLLVVGLALVAILTIAGLQPHAVSGRAEMGRVPGAPRIGQCLLQAPDEGGGGQSFRLGSCGTRHYGEVAQVSELSGADDAGARCADPADFLGWSPPAASAAHVQWQPIDVNLLRMTPTRLQRSFGQHWVVCVVTPLISGAAYTGSVRGVLATGRVPVAFAECIAALYLSGSVPCDQPHPYELFASAVLPVTFRNQSGLDADCRSIAARATRMPDLTAGGALDVRAVPFHQNADGATVNGLPDGTGDVGAQALCLVGVTGERLLRGSLFGLGTGPLPWA